MKGAALSAMQHLRQRLGEVACQTVNGRLKEVRGGLLYVTLPGQARIGELCWVRDPFTSKQVSAEVISLEVDAALLAPLGSVEGLSNQAIIIFTGKALSVGVGDALLGRVLDGLGNPLDEDQQGELRSERRYPVFAAPDHPLSRQLISHPLELGIRAIDGLLTCGQGQRLGIYGAAGMGKSTLIGDIVSGASADVTVVALIGERGREVREFLTHNVNQAAMKRTVFVVATSDRPAVERIKAANVATAIAESFRDEGRNILLVVDSVTRIARAYREVGLAAGEPATRRGFPPSVFAALPALFERAGPSAQGTITAFYTVLVEGELRQDPIADETIGLLDGHIVLSPKLSQAGHFPAIDVLQSLSRLMNKLVDDEQQTAASHVRRLLARYQEIELLIRIGEYEEGSDPLSDEAIEKRDQINDFLQQRGGETEAFDSTLQQLQDIVEQSSPDQKDEYLPDQENEEWR